MSASTTDFNAQVNKFIDTIPDRANDIKVKLGLQLLERIVAMTPVDSGRARGNWQVSIDEPVANVIALKSKNGNAAISAGSQTILNTVTGQSIWISNNLPYIERLEQGWSGQAPFGMIAGALAEVGSQFD
tara:strand:+ start:188 stop:577 length:390 start_codon:yes stop_codon:yes gene_type:complete